MPDRSPATTFADRHLGPRPEDVERMLATLGVATLDELIDQAVPKTIRSDQPLRLPDARSEPEVLATLRRLASRNEVVTSLIGCGYSGTHTPGVIQRNVLEAPAWYTAYTPYQPEISQGRLEALLNFQTMVTDLTGHGHRQRVDARRVDRRRRGDDPHPPLHQARRAPRSSSTPRRTRRPSRSSPPRAEPIGIELVVGDLADLDPSAVFGALAAAPGHDRAWCATSPPPSPPCTRPAGSWPSPPTCWPARCSRLRASRAPTCASARRSASACRSATAAPTPGSSPRATRSAAPCPAGWSACRSTPPADPPTASPCRPASSTSAGRRPPPTSAPPRCCSPSSRRCTPCTTAPRGCGTSPSAVHGRTARLAAVAARRRRRAASTTTYFDTLAARVPGRADEVLAAALERGVNLRRIDADTRRHRARRDHHRRRPRPGGRRLRRRRPSRRRRRRRIPERAAPHAPSTSPTPCSAPTAPRPSCCATSAGSPTWTSPSTGR